MKHRLSIASLLVAVAALCLNGCTTPSSTPTASQNTGKPDSLIMLVTSSPSATGLKALADTYKAETGITINFVEVPSAQLATKIILAKQSGQSTFDMAQLDGFNLPQVVATGAFLGLDDYLAKDKDYDYADFAQGLKNYAMMNGVSYGLPLSTEPYVQWYRTDLFEARGLKPATTWAELETNAQAFTGTGEYGFAGVYGPGSATYYYSEMLHASGGRLLDPDTYEPLLDRPWAKTVMERYLSYIKISPASSVSGASIDAVNAFSQMEIGQMITATGWFSSLNDPAKSNAAGHLATAATPMSKDGPYEPASSLYGWLAGISSVSPNQDAAWDFLSWALGKSNVQAFIDVGAPPPGRTSTVTNPTFIEQLPYLPSVGDAVENGVPLPRIPEMGQIVSILSQDINAMASGQLTVDEGLEKAQNDLLNILVQSGRYKG